MVSRISNNVVHLGIIGPRVGSYLILIGIIKNYKYVGEHEAT